MGLLGNFIGHHLRPRAAGQPSSHEAQILDWVAKGLPAPPPHAVKQAVVRTYAKRYSINTLVETGTFFGEMVEAMKHDFERIYSIELSQQLFEKAAARFKGESNITLIQGDSGLAIREVLKQLTGPALFWLDGHWSEGVTARGSRDTPVREELDAILAAGDPGHVVLIDDARLFGSDPAYPSLDELRVQFLAPRPLLTLTVDADIIRIAPRPAGGAPC